jgi:hypothetical protein
MGIPEKHYIAAKRLGRESLAEIARDPGRNSFFFFLQLYSHIFNKVVQKSVGRHVQGLSEM